MTIIRAGKFCWITFYIANGADNKGIIHLAVKILEGRTDEIKSEIGKILSDIEDVF